jgi:hypothetical protein
VGGVEQIPLTSNGLPSSAWSYTLDRFDNNSINLTFNDPLPVESYIDVRSFCTAQSWATNSIFPVAVYSLDPISDQFDGSTLSFPLTYLGDPINPMIVSEDNLIVSLGGAIQIPKTAYTVNNGFINFQSGVEAPQTGTTVNLRLITNSEFISCQVGSRTASTFLKWGPELVLKISRKTGIS